MNRICKIAEISQCHPIEISIGILLIFIALSIFVSVVANYINEIMQTKKRY